MSSKSYKQRLQTLIDDAPGEDRVWMVLVNKKQEHIITLQGYTFSEMWSVLGYENYASLVESAKEEGVTLSNKEKLKFEGTLVEQWGAKPRQMVMFFGNTEAFSGDTEYMKTYLAELVSLYDKGDIDMCHLDRAVDSSLHVTLKLTFLSKVQSFIMVRCRHCY